MYKTIIFEPMDYICILDFGSQYTQLIARRVRELKVYAEIIAFNKLPNVHDPSLKGIILSGSPCSVNEESYPEPQLEKFIGKVPILGVCYGAQYLAKIYGGNVSKSKTREYGRAMLKHESNNALFKNVEELTQVWMSHGDTILDLPNKFDISATTENIPIAGFASKPSFFEAPVFGIQFHPEVTHSTEGKTILSNFVFDVCKASSDWTAAHFIDSTVQQIKEKVGDQKVIMGLSGGVDSTISASLIHRAIGDQLTSIFVNNGLLRKNEFTDVVDSYNGMGFNIIPVDASDLFLNALEGVSDPEKKRKIIGKIFIDVFQEEANKIEGATFLGQGTIYPDVIESVSVVGPSVTIKSHHNVGGLPEKMNLQLVEPLRMLFKDEVRNIGRELGVSEHLVGRHPFPGPGLAIRILGEITRERISILQEADHIYIQELKSTGWYDKVWQAGAILLPIKSVGVMGDERSYESTIALRCVNSVDGMTADWSQLPYNILADISNKIINHVKGINRVVYDISSKPPATIEWE